MSNDFTIEKNSNYVLLSSKKHNQILDFYGFYMILDSVKIVEIDRHKPYLNKSMLIE